MFAQDISLLVKSTPTRHELLLNLERDASQLRGTVKASGGLYSEAWALFYYLD